MTGFLVLSTLTPTYPHQSALLDGRFPNATITNVFCISASAVDDNQLKTVTSTRKSEDEAFFRSLNAPVDVVYLDRIDAPLRLGITDDDVCNVSSLCKEELSYLRDFIESRSPTLLIAPLSLGNHIDHSLVHHTACQLAMDGWPVVFYEDLPYAGGIELEELEDVIKKTSVILGRNLRPQQLIAGSRGSKKMDAISTYNSQLGPTTLKRIIHRSLRLNKFAITERLWW